MNRWAERHGASLRDGLHEDEKVLVAARVAVARRSRARLDFPVPGHVFVLGLSDRRLLFWRASRWLGRPGPFATAVALDQVAALDLVHRIGVARLRVTLATGSMLLLEPAWGGSLRALNQTFVALNGHR